MAVKNYDNAQKKAIDTIKNSVVSAGAGSGKTSVLSARFSHLVKDLHYGVDQILTLTFTKKATVEMYDRIYKAIADDPLAASNFHKANIKTLDSYCASVAKLGAHFYGISPDFTEDDNAVRDQVSMMALEFILEHKDNPVIKHFVGTKDFSEIAQSLFAYPVLENSTVASPIDFDGIISRQKEEVIRAWKEAATNISDAANDLDKSVAEFCGNKNSTTIQNYINALEQFNDDCETVYITEEMIEESDSTLLEKYIQEVWALAGLRKPGRMNGAESIKEAHDNLRNSIGNILPLANYVHGFSFAKETLSLLKEFEKKVNDYKRSTGLLTFADVSSLALCILRDHPEIRQVEKRRYKAIMIDEFQDNNSMQRDMLFMLAEKEDRMEKGIPDVTDLNPEKLFFVGDEKQSIYRFRGADVSVFRALSSNFPEGNMELETNYRSRPALIAMFNTLFGGENYPENKSKVSPASFYTSEAEEVPDYEAVYHHVKYGKHWEEELKSGKETFAPRTYVGIITEKTENTEEDEARWIAEKIKHLIEEENYKPSDIAILFRNYSPQPVYERMLLNYGIPYSTEVVKGLFSDGPVNDVFAWLRLSAYPADTMAYAKALRSPLVNLNAEETNAVLAKKSDAFSENGMSSLSEEAKARYLKGKELFEKITESTKTESLTRTIDLIWYDAGYRFETSWNNSVAMYSSLYDRMFELARLSEQNGMSVSDFVDSVRTYEDEAQKLEGMDIPLEQTDSVKLMTIFKSKGLEFKVVFMVSCHKQTPNENNARAVYSSKKFGITVNTPTIGGGKDSSGNYFYNLAHEENRAMESAELRRIAYVGATRAIEKLYISGVRENSFADSDKYIPGNDAHPIKIFDVFAPAFEFYLKPGNADNSPFEFETISFDEEEIKSTRKVYDKEAFLKRAKDFYENAKIIEKETVIDPHLSPSALHVEVEKSTAGDSLPYQEINELVESSRGFGYNDFGTIVHAYLEAALKGEEVVLKNQWIVGLDGSEKKLEVVKKTALKMKEEFLESQVGKAALLSDWKKMEYDFRCKVGERILSGQMDLLFKDKDGNYTVVDYKTDSIMAPEEHSGQLASYQVTVSELFGVERSSVKCILYYLRHGKAVDVTESCTSFDLEKAVNGF